MTFARTWVGYRYATRHLAVCRCQTTLCRNCDIAHKAAQTFREAYSTWFPLPRPEA